MNNALATHSITKTTASIVVRNIKARNRVFQGRKYEGQVSAGQHAEIVPGKKIVLWGVDTNKIGGLLPYRIEFKIGDVAEYDSFNIAYTGTIVSIGAKTVTIESHGRKYQLDLATFSRRNHDFDLAAIQKRNSEWMD